MPSGTATSTPVTSRRPKRQRGRERVAALMAAAVALFGERGYDATTMTEIAARAGASIGSLYLFFPTKAALAQTVLVELAAALSARVEGLGAQAAGQPAAAIADALFAELAVFLRENPVYAVLVELPGDEGWRRTVRARRRAEIAALFGLAEPPLPEGQAGRLALLIPSLMRVAVTLDAGSARARDEVLAELRAMIRHHLAWPGSTEGWQAPDAVEPVS